MMRFTLQRGAALVILLCLTIARRPRSAITWASAGAGTVSCGRARGFERPRPFRHLCC